ncbi:hypothetical protein DFH07DRAFT_781824 [Mycena maculata]|uniref:Alpha-type protein kinase domain-containing protein n=1 Tax=Mycena maculata TaxID=230809 RepID=A0AAD7MTF4_9AGAR|nr:hypothetical protein DFH07DRAFT_781824 [Mycena maculata]
MSDSSFALETTVTQCVGKQLGDGCNGDFPRKDYAGLCARCLMLESLVDNPLEYSLLEHDLQVSIYRNILNVLIVVPLHVISREKDVEGVDACRDQVIVEAERAFGQAFQDKMRAGKLKKKVLANTDQPWATPAPVAPISWKEISSGSPSLSLTTTNLNHLRNAAKGALGRMITVNFTPVVGGGNAIWLPQTSDMVHADTSVSEWETNSGSSLIRTDVLLQWHKGQNLLLGSLNGTIGELYDMHQQDHNAGTYFKNVPQKWRHIKGQSFEARTKMSAPPAAYGKRGSESQLHPVDERPGKRVRTSVNPPPSVANSSVVASGSRFQSQVQVHGPLSRSQISLRIASVTVGTTDGRVEISWDTNDRRSAILDDTHCAAGKTKKVYQILLNGEPYVAKRFFEIGNGRGIVSIDENSTQLAKELTRLAQGDWFLNKFYERAEETSTEVSPDFMFARGLLAQEILDEYEPSLASGMTMHEFLKSTSSNPNGAITWLLEPLRAASMERWSGTKGRAPSGKSALILFDVMTHTLSQDSGVGDHGPDGIEVILAGHTCGAMCDGLEMGEENTISESFKKPKKARKGKNRAE